VIPAGSPALRRALGPTNRRSQGASRGFAFRIILPVCSLIIRSTRCWDAKAPAAIAQHFRCRKRIPRLNPSRFRVGPDFVRCLDLDPVAGCAPRVPVGVGCPCDFFLRDREWSPPWSLWKPCRAETKSRNPMPGWQASGSRRRRALWSCAGAVVASRTSRMYCRKSHHFRRLGRLKQRRGLTTPYRVMRIAA